MSKAEIDKKAKEAKNHASEDKAKRELIDLHNQADRMASLLEQQTTEIKIKVFRFDLKQPITDENE